VRIFVLALYTEKITSFGREYKKKYTLCTIKLDRDGFKNLQKFL